jgi:hypothetical protein
MDGWILSSRLMNKWAVFGTLKQSGFHPARKVHHLEKAKPKTKSFTNRWLSILTPAPAVLKVYSFIHFLTPTYATERLDFYPFNTYFSLLYNGITVNGIIC